MTTDRSKSADTIVNANSFSDHDLIGFIRKMHTMKYKPRKILVRDYKKYDPVKFKSDLRNIPWENCFSESDYNSAWKVYKNYLTDTINKHAPLTKRMIKGRDTPWMSQQIKRIMNTRDYHLRKARRTNTKEDWG